MEVDVRKSRKKKKFKSHVDVEKIDKNGVTAKRGSVGWY